MLALCPGHFRVVRIVLVRSSRGGGNKEEQVQDRSGHVLMQTHSIQASRALGICAAERSAIAPSFTSAAVMFRPLVYNSRYGDGSELLSCCEPLNEPSRSLLLRALGQCPYIRCSRDEINIFKCQVHQSRCYQACRHFPKIMQSRVENVSTAVPVGHGRPRL